LKDDIKRINADIFPYDEIAPREMEQMVKALAERNFIIRYVIDGKAFIQVRSFAKHQRIHPREVPSTIPGCASVRAQALPGHYLGAARDTTQVRPRPATSTSTSTSTSAQRVSHASQRARADPDEFERITEQIWNEHPADRRGSLQLCRQYASAALENAIDAPRVLELAAENHLKWLAVWSKNGYSHSLKRWWTEGHWRLDPGSPIAASEELTAEEQEIMRAFRGGK
jgi:hypothetical protein